MEIGKQINKFRAEMKLSQDELAERIFVSRQTISNWETGKNYPDVKNLVLLSSLFGVSLDILIKGDIEKMKEKINAEGMRNFKCKSTVFSVLILSIILTPVPLIKIGGYIGAGLWALIALVTLVYAFQVEKLKKALDIQTYREIVAFTEGKTLGEADKNREHGKRPYQKFLLAIGAGLLTIAVTSVMYLLF